MVNIHIGCAGWDYKDWIGPFYPKKLEKFQYLNYYSRFFELVEINSTFYNLPSEETVINWTKQVPKNFRFVVKLWQEITHNIHSSDLDDKVYQFYYRMKPLESKISAFLFQFPPWLKYSEEILKKLIHLIDTFPFKNSILVIELRDNSWFDKQILSQFIDGERKILGTTYMPKFSPYYLSNQKYYYIRLIGDRELTIFNRIQRNQDEAISHLNENINILIIEPEINEIFIIVNNHFAGFAPGTANLIKKKLNLQIKQYSKQKNIGDFI